MIQDQFPALILVFIPYFSVTSPSDILGRAVFQYSVIITTMNYHKLMSQWQAGLSQEFFKEVDSS